MKKSLARVLVLLGLVSLIFTVGSGCDGSSKSAKNVKRQLQKVKQKEAPSQRKVLLVEKGGVFLQKSSAGGDGDKKLGYQLKLKHVRKKRDILCGVGYECRSYCRGLLLYDGEPAFAAVLWTLEAFRLGCRMTHSETFDLREYGKTNLLETQKVLLEVIKKDESRHVVKAAIDALGGLGASSVPMLLEGYRDGNRSVRVKIAEVLGGLGTQAKEALPLLYKALRKKRNYLYKDIRNSRMKPWRIHLSAGRAIAQIAPLPNEGFHAQIQFLEVKNCELLKFYPDRRACQLDYMGRTYAIRTLGKLGFKIAKTTPLLVKFLSKEHWYLSENDAAKDTLNIFGESGVPWLIKGLRFPEKQVRLEVIRILKGFGAKSRKALPYLRKLRRSKDSLLRREAKRAVQQIFKAWRKTKKRSFKAKREKPVILAQRKTAFSKRGLSFGRKLRQRESKFRYYLKFEKVDNFLDTLCRKLKRREDCIKASNLEKVSTSRAVLMILGIFRLPFSRQLRADMIFQLRKRWKVNPKETLKILLEVIKKDSNRYVVEMSIRALVEFGASSIPMLIELYQQRQVDFVRMKIAEALGGFGTQAKKSLPLLYESLRKRSTDKSKLRKGLWKIYLPAARAIAQIAPFPNKGFYVLSQFLEVQDCTSREKRLKWRVCEMNNLGRAYAAKSLGILGPKAVKTTPLLLKLSSKSRSDEEKREASTALDLFGDGALPWLIKGLKSSDKEIRSSAISLLHKLGATAKKALPHLKKLQKSKDLQIRTSAKSAVHEISGIVIPITRIYPTNLRIHINEMARERKASKQ